MKGLQKQLIEQHKLNILVVDDEDFNLEIISELLHDRGYQVDTADNGIDACALLRKHPDKYHCVLLDRMMPELDGMAVLQFMKNDSKLCYIPVIMQTAKASRDDIQDGLNAGVLYYITKPFNEMTLLNIVDCAVKEFLDYSELAQSVVAMQSRAENHGHFVFRTIEEARETATLLANTCPDPERVVFGLSELLINAVEHGNLGITYEDKTQILKADVWHDEIKRRLQLPEYQQRKVTVSLDITDQEIIFIIKDDGEGFDSEKYLIIDPDRACNTHGRGIAMARLVSFDRLEYFEDGTQVLAAIKLR